MGIRPYSRGQVPVRAAPDSAETRFKPWVDDLEDSGTKTGEAWAAIDAKAESANSGAGELAADLTELEKRVEAFTARTEVSGTGWAAYKQAGLVTLVLAGASAGFVLPEGYRPPRFIYPSLSLGKASMNGRFEVRPTGQVTLIEATPPSHGIVSYPAAG